VLDSALAQLPVNPADHEIIVRSDAAGLSHDFVDAARARGSGSVLAIASWSTWRR
jgi:hypothetical protein